MNQPRPPVRGSVAPLVRRALELLAARAAGVDRLVAVEIPAAMAPRLEASDLVAAGCAPDGGSAVVVVSGPGIGRSRIAVLLHPRGDRYTAVLKPAGGSLPAGLAASLEGLDTTPPALDAGDEGAREWLQGAAATLTRSAADLEDDHRWWGDVGALIMLADLVQEGAPGG